MRAYVRDHPDDFHCGGKSTDGENDDDDDTEDGDAVAGMSFK
jgi:hypothetical protein